MKILITNSHSVRNAGDRVLLEIALEELRANFPGSEITVAVNSTLGLDQRAQESYVGSFMNWFKSVQGGVEQWNWRSAVMLPWWLLQTSLVALTYRFFRRPRPMPGNVARRKLLLAYCESDLIVSCPGNFLYSGSGLGAAFLLHVFALAYGGLLGKPLYMMPQTIGPLTRRRERWLLRGLLRQMRFVSLRDSVSLAPVLALGVPAGRCRVLPDSAFLFHGSGDLRPFSKLVRGRLRRSSAAAAAGSAADEDLSRPYLGVTVIDWGAKNRRFTRQAEYERAVGRALAAFLAKHGGTAFVFPQVTGPARADDDRIPSARVAEMLGIHAVQIDSVWSPGQLQAAYGQMDVVLGTRLHSCIFALTAGTPVLAIAYQYKTRGVFDMLGLSDWVIDIAHVSESLLTERLETLWQRRTDIGMLIQRRLPPIQEEARQAAALIAADYTQLTRGSEGRQPLRIRL